MMRMERLLLLRFIIKTVEFWLSANFWQLQSFLLSLKQIGLPVLINFPLIYEHLCCHRLQVSQLLNLKRLFIIIVFFLIRVTFPSDKLRLDQSSDFPRPLHPDLLFHRIILRLFEPLLNNLMPQLPHPIRQVLLDIKKTRRREGMDFIRLEGFVLCCFHKLQAMQYYLITMGKMEYQKNRNHISLNHSPIVLVGKFVSCLKTIFFITKMLQNRIVSHNSSSIGSSKDRHCRTQRVTTRPTAFQQNIVQRQRLTHDVGQTNESNELENMTKFKEAILRERSANIKSFHLKVKDQDDMIREMRTRVIENKSNQKSMVNSRFSGFDSDVGQNTAKKLSVLENSICKAKRIQRSSSRTRYLLSRTNSKDNISQAKSRSLTPIEQLTIVKFPQTISSKIFEVDRSVKRFLEEIQDLQKQHQNLRYECSLSQQQIQNAITSLADLQIQKQKENKHYQAANQRLKHIQYNIQQLIERQRRKYLMERTYYLRDITNRLSF